MYIFVKLLSSHTLILFTFPVHILMQKFKKEQSIFYVIL